MAKIRNKNTGDIHELPYNYTDSYGNSGVVDLENGKLVNYLGTTLSNEEDSVYVRATLSVINTFEVYEGDTPPDPIVLNCGVPITATFISRTNLGNVTQFKLSLNKQAFPVQVNSDLMGGLADDTINNEVHGTFQNISPQSDGTYLVICKSIGVPNVIYFKYTDCTEFIWLKYTTFPVDTLPEEGGSGTLDCNTEITVASMTSSNLGSNITQFKLFLNKQAFPIQVNTDLMGGVVDANTPGTFQSISQQSDGSYLVNCISTGEVSTIYLKYVNCTKVSWAKYTTFDPDSGGTLITPPTITYPKDVVLSYWLQDMNDFRNCDPINPYYPNCNINGYAENTASNAAKSRIKNYKFRNLTKPPFYAVYHPVKHIGDGGGNSGDTDFNLHYDQEAFDKTLEYAYECGAKAFDFYFYDNDTDVSEHIRFNQTTTSPYKNYIKYYYTLGSLGFNAKPTMDRIVSHMNQSRYYKIDNKPVLLIDTPENSLFHVDRYVLPEGATYYPPIDGYPDGYYLGNAGYTGPIKFSPESGYVKASGDTPYHVMVDYIKSQYYALHGGNLYLIKQGGYWYHNGTNVPEINEDAVSNYLAISSGDTLNNHSYNLITDDNITAVTSVLTSTSNNIVPTICMGFNNVGDAGGAGQVPSNTNTATTAEVIDHFNKIKTLCNSYPSRIPFVKVYSFGETSECGGGAVVPRKNPDGSIDKDKILAIRQAVSN